MVALGYRCWTGWWGALLGALAGVVWPGPVAQAADDGPTVELQVQGTLPFSQEALRRAVSLRLVLAASDEKSPSVVSVSVRAVRGGVEVGVGDKRRVVDHGGARGTPAARRVALAITDLVMSSPALPDLLPPATPAAPVRPVRPDDGARGEVGRARPEATARVGASATIGSGSNLSTVLFTAAVDGALLLSDGLAGFLSIGLAVAPDTTLRGVTISYSSVPLRGGLQWRPPDTEWQLRAAFVLAPHVVTPRLAGGATGTVPDETHAGVTTGVGAALAYLIPLSDRLDLRVGGGLDVYVDRVEFRIRGTPALATERLAIWIGAGSSWGLGW